jgi:hypothetical protein
VSLIPVTDGVAVPFESIKISKSDRVLYSFVATIIPDIDIKNRSVIKHFYDKELDFNKVKTLFLLQLRCTSKRMFKNANFDELTHDQRMAVIEDGLQGCELKSKIFSGAIFLTQVAIYCDIYQENQGSELFRYETAKLDLINPEEYHYARLEGIGARSITIDGNYN